MINASLISTYQKRLNTQKNCNKSSERGLSLVHSAKNMLHEFLNEKWSTQDNASSSSEEEAKLLSNWLKVFAISNKFFSCLFLPPPSVEEGYKQWRTLLQQLVKVASVVDLVVMVDQEVQEVDVEVQEEEMRSQHRPWSCQGRPERMDSCYKTGSLEVIYLFSLPITEYEIIVIFIGSELMMRY
nr:unnamed protein product [Callosobruchus chinensis]